MEENMQCFWHIMLYYFKKGKNETKTQKMRTAYGDGAMADQTCQKWFTKFCAGDFLPDDAPQSGRPVEVGSDQIETLTENNHRYTTWERGDVLKTSKSIKLLVKMKKCVSYFMEKTIQTFWPTQ